MRRSKGMTLIELLISLGLSVIIMAATFVIVKYSSDTFKGTMTMIENNNNTHDASNVINKYIRCADFFAISDGNKSLLISGSSQSGSNLYETVKLIFAEEDKCVYIDRLNGETPMILAKEIYRMDWEIIMNGVKYTAYTHNSKNEEIVYFFGYAYKRGE